MFAQILNLEIDFDTDSVRLQETPQWDSVRHLSLVIAVEEEFGVELESDQIVRMESFEAVVTILRELGYPV
jgi:acyl carrier protein